jgi:hypothetical protein
MSHATDRQPRTIAYAQRPLPSPRQRSKSGDATSAHLANTPPRPSPHRKSPITTQKRKKAEMPTPGKSRLPAHAKTRPLAHTRK